MNNINEQLFDNAEQAIIEAKKSAPNTVRVAITSDFANLSRQGYDSSNNVTFRIYRTFDSNYRQKYQIRYCFPND